MRRQSLSSCSSNGTGNGTGEPLIVVEESLLGEDEAELGRTESPPRCVDPDSPSMNPYLLSPWREARKHSLPTPQCTSGITASQVRRLSERGDGSGPTPKEAAFLSTLSQAPAPQPGGRRHSVVNISRVPPTFFGRNRRESIAAFPLGASRVLTGRRDSTSSIGMPPSNNGSAHNLLDILDDIAEIKAKKVPPMKMVKTSLTERICEAQTMEGNNGSDQRSHRQQQCRRFSDFTGTDKQSLPGPSSVSVRRRASEMIIDKISSLGLTSRWSTDIDRETDGATIVRNREIETGGDEDEDEYEDEDEEEEEEEEEGKEEKINTIRRRSKEKMKSLGIVGSLTLSATEIDRCGIDDREERRKRYVERLRDGRGYNIRENGGDNRSNSIDLSIFEKKERLLVDSRFSKEKIDVTPGSTWFAKRNQPTTRMKIKIKTKTKRKNNEDYDETTTTTTTTTRTRTKRESSEDKSFDNETTNECNERKSTISSYVARTESRSIALKNSVSIDATERRSSENVLGSRDNIRFTDDNEDNNICIGADPIEPVANESSTSRVITGDSIGSTDCSSKSLVSTPNKPRSSPSKLVSWFSGISKDEQQDNSESCESSLCSSLKHLFVK